ncbi:MAG: hypothetical protein LBV13_03200 [Methanomassiliicoccaceae archaeon]|jgi:hypothetical protein|nr:hypothetical protein [Methanomassiliicoccaceae archaeon]
MDGMSMKAQPIKRSAHVSELSLVREQDKAILLIFLVSMALCIIAIALLLIFTELEVGAVLLAISAPFLIVGLVTYVSTGMWKMLLLAIVVPAAAFFLIDALPILVIFFIAFLMIGCVGVVSVSAILQRKVFYLVISIIEYANIKEKLSLFERLVVFFFNVPPDIDTRKITMDYNLKRSGIPFREMMGTMLFAFLVGLSMWIYLSMNPAFMTDIIDLTEAPIFVFSLVMFIPLIVLPWTPFKSLNVRITTNHRDFSIYGGILETLRKMAIPIFAVFLFIMIALNRSNIAHVMGFIGLSVAFNLLVVAASCIIFYLFFEPGFVDDAASKWKIFRPVQMNMELEEKGKIDAKDLPGTPSRDLSDIGDL